MRRAIFFVKHGVITLNKGIKGLLAVLIFIAVFVLARVAGSALVGTSEQLDLVAMLVAVPFAVWFVVVVHARSVRVGTDRQAQALD
jgi:hypothetical protein